MTLWRSIPLANPPAYTAEEDILIRQSTINTLQLCAKRVELQQQKGYLEPVGEKLVFGSLLHELIAADLNVDTDVDTMIVDMDHWIEPYLNEKYQWSIGMIPDYGKFKQQLTIGYRTWAHQVKPKINSNQITAVEETLELYLGEADNSRGVFLQGTADLIMEDRIIDWKTTGRAWSQTKADLSIQASLYMPLAKQQYGLATREFTFWIYVRTSNPYWQPLSTSRRVKDIDSALQTAYNYGLQIDAGVYPATPVPESDFNKKRGWYCSPKWCGGWNICTSKYLHDNVNEQIRAERTW